MLATGVARAGSPPAGEECTRSFPSTLKGKPPQPTLRPEQLIQEQPNTGAFSLEGFVVDRHACGKCPPQASCKPCEPNITLSSTQHAGVKQPVVFDLDVRIEVPDGNAFQLFSRYRVRVVVCRHYAVERKMFDLELRSYERLP